MFDDIIKEVSIKRFGHTSLYTWMRNNISDRLLQKRNQLTSISLLREDGFNISYDIYNENYVNPRNDVNYEKRVLHRVEEIITSVKNARMHERVLLTIRKTGIDLLGNNFDESEVYLLIRFADKEYVHQVYGPKIKQVISAEQIALPYLKDYVNHFTISGKVSEIVNNKKLLSIVSLNKIDNDKFINLKEKLGDKDISVLEISKSLNDISNLSVIYNALPDNEKQTLKKLPFLGFPNYSITHDLKLKIYLKSSTAESFGNGNANSLYI